MAERTRSYALDLSGEAWRQATFDNPTNNDVWASPEQGAVVLWWKYTGTVNAGMLMQITGKCQSDKSLDTDDGIQIVFHGNTQLRLRYYWNNAQNSTYIQYSHGAAFTADQWYKVTAKWNTATAPFMYLQLDDRVPATGSAVQPGATACGAWHHLLLGNDTPTVPSGLFLDDVRVYNDYAMVPEPGSLAFMVVGLVGLLSRR